MKLPYQGFGSALKEQPGFVSLQTESHKLAEGCKHKAKQAIFSLQFHQLFVCLFADASNATVHFHAFSAKKQKQLPAALCPSRCR